MTEQQLKTWLEKLKEIWEIKNPSGVLDLIAEKFIWHETPFDKPITTKEDLLREWQNVLNQDKINVSYEIYNIRDNIGIAHWSATFIRIPSKEKVELDGIYKVTLDTNGKCIEFHQWYNSASEEDKDEKDLMDAFYKKAKELVIKHNKASAFFLQSKLLIDYERAIKLLNQLQANGVIGPELGSDPRRILIKE